MKFFHLSVHLTNEKPDAFVCPFDKPIKSLYFRSFVVSVLFISRSYENRSTEEKKIEKQGIPQNTLHTCLPRSADIAEPIKFEGPPTKNPARGYQDAL